MAKTDVDKKMTHDSKREPLIARNNDAIGGDVALDQTTVQTTIEHSSWHDDVIAKDDLSRINTASPQDDHSSYAVITLCGNNDATIAVLADHNEARRIAAYAITPDGGYCSVVVRATSAPVTHKDLESWICG